MSIRSAASAYQVVGIDNSPGAIEVCRLRGLTGAHLMSLGQLDESLGRFDTVLMLGGGFGLLGTPERARQTLQQLGNITSPRGRILAANRDRASEDDRDRQGQARRNLHAGRISGQTRIRIRYRYHSTPYFDYFRCSPAEMSAIVEGTGWTVSRMLETSPGEPYVGVIEKV